MTMTSGQHRLLATSRTASAYVLTAGRYTMATLATALSLASTAAAAEFIIPMGMTTQGKRMRGVEIAAFGSGANNGTGGFRAWRLERGVKNGSLLTNDFELTFLGEVATTLGTCAGAASGDLVSSTELLADMMVLTRGTLSSTPKGISDSVDTSYVCPAANVYSPADNTPARFFLVDVGGGDLLIEPIKTTATDQNVIWVAVV